MKFKAIDLTFLMLALSTFSCSSVFATETLNIRLAFQNTFALETHENQTWKDHENQVSADLETWSTEEYSVFRGNPAKPSTSAKSSFIAATQWNENQGISLRSVTRKGSSSDSYFYPKSHALEVFIDSSNPIIPSMISPNVPHSFSLDATRVITADISIAGNFTYETTQKFTYANGTTVLKQKQAIWIDYQPYEAYPLTIEGLIAERSRIIWFARHGEPEPSPSETFHITFWISENNQILKISSEVNSVFGFHPGSYPQYPIQIEDPYLGYLNQFSNSVNDFLYHSSHYDWIAYRGSNQPAYLSRYNLWILSLEGNPQAGIWLYSPTLSSWLWTRQDVFPWAWDGENWITLPPNDDL